MSLLEARNITKDYATGEVVTQVLRGVNFKVEKGEFISIMGPSGSGKSTLMHILGFLDRPTVGEYLFNNQNTAQLTDDELAEMRSKKVGFVFQSFNLLPRVSVWENVILPLIYAKVPKAERKEKARQLLTEVGLEHRLEYLPNQLSGGEKQRVAIARALVNDPEVVFADEPTGNLDSKSGLQVMKILQDLNQGGRTIILVTHEHYTAEHANRVIRLKDGEIVQDAPVDHRVLAEELVELKK